MTIHATLCFILDDNRVLLLKKNPAFSELANGTHQAASYNPKKLLNTALQEKSTRRQV